MATSSQWYAQSGGGMIARLWTAQEMKIALMQPAFVPDIDNQMRLADVASGEIAAGGGYVAGGLVLTGKSVAYDAAANEYNLLAADPSWGPGATLTARFAVIYENTTVDKYLWSIHDFGADQNIANGTFLLDWANILLSVAAGPAV